MKCKICQDNEANKSGSHIVPFFLLKRIDNLEGKKDRGYELGFRLSENGSRNYFGQSVLPDKLDELYEDFDPSNFNNIEIPLIEDFIFCDVCEKRLQVLETEYAKSLSKSGNKSENYQSININSLGFLFWLSVIWRLSISKNSGFNLMKPDEKTIHRILKKNLKDDLSSIKLSFKDPDLQKIKYKVLRSSDFSKSNSTLLFCDPVSRKPYFFVIDEFIVLLFMDRLVSSSKENIPKRIQLQINNAVLNSPFSKETILEINYEDLQFMNSTFYEKLTEVFFKNLSLKLDLLHQRLGKSGKMPEIIKHEIKNKLIYEEKKMGEKYSSRHIIKVIAEVVSKYTKL